MESQIESTELKRMPIAGQIESIRSRGEVMADTASLLAIVWWRTAGAASGARGMCGRGEVHATALLHGSRERSPRTCSGSGQNAAAPTKYRE
jgi:hypothetical protein